MQPYAVEPRRWQCRTCGEIYDEALGSPQDGIAPGTRFADLPEAWLCPVCGSPRADFELLDS